MSAPRSRMPVTASRPLAFDPHGGAMAEHASKIVAAIDSGDAKAALAAAESPDAAAKEGSGAH